MPTSTIFLNNPVIVDKIFLLKLRLLFLYDSIIMVVYVKWTNPWNNTSIIYGITLNFPKRECIRGIPRATEFPRINTILLLVSFFGGGILVFIIGFQVGNLLFKYKNKLKNRTVEIKGLNSFW